VSSHAPAGTFLPKCAKRRRRRASPVTVARAVCPSQRRIGESSAGARHPWTSKATGSRRRHRRRHPSPAQGLHSRPEAIPVALPPHGPSAILQRQAANRNPLERLGLRQVWIDGSGPSRHAFPLDRLRGGGVAARGWADVGDRLDRACAHPRDEARRLLLPGLPGRLPLLCPVGGPGNSAPGNPLGATCRGARLDAAPFHLLRRLRMPRIDPANSRAST
jgi:hypothetical protein